MEMPVKHPLEKHPRRIFPGEALPRRKRSARGFYLFYSKNGENKPWKGFLSFGGEPSLEENPFSFWIKCGLTLIMTLTLIVT